jgi:hypothetical protein
VLIGVAVEASLECQSLLEITTLVTLHAPYGLVLALERVLGFGMIKVLADVL